MAVVTSDLLSAQLVGARAIFNTAFPAALEQQPWLRLVLDGTAIDSTGKESMQYGWLTQVPKMNRWNGTLQIGGLTGDDFTLVNHLYTAAFAVDRLAFERDQLQMIAPRTTQLAQEAARYPGELIFDLLNNGASTSVDSPTYDGSAFFYDTRTYGASGTIDNILSTAGTSAANFRTDLAAARSQMASFKDDKGRPMNVVPNLIVIHPSASAAVWEALNTGPGATEPGVTPAGTLGGTMWSARGYTVIESAYLTDTGATYFIHTSPGLAPFLYQVEIAPQVEGITTPNSESGIINEQFIYKVRGSFAVGYGDPRLCILTT